MVVSFVIGLPIALLSVLHPQTPPRECLLEVLGAQALDQRADADFNATIQQYLALQRRLVRAMSVPFFMDDEGIGSEELRTALVAARPLAHEGAFFTPAVARSVTERLDRALLLGTAEATIVLNQPRPDELSPQVNRAVPAAALAASIVWPGLTRTLPALPPELDYAIWGRDLVLIDIAANLVLDVLRDALPEGAYLGVEYQ
jgi:hypothetical protein